ncbi:response regulator [Cohnella zeiphila]|uniref:Response regulator n=1 Tax=Cohnella zeiphila TaxID=2761120 RepID=A0A7X0SN59_9BACL|nr:response regulator [Cohnella zeiphila]MBB6733078.1 response regulator [Cohnella zeiphila]
MKGLLVDDEALALLDLEKQLGKVGGIEIVGTYQNVHDALEAAERLKPDVVFLDIDMPEIGGLEAAERFHDLLPSIQIVFVTAYEEYAVKAFELQALDYILKPVRAERLRLTVERIASRFRTEESLAPVSGPIAIYSFQRMQIEYHQREQLPWRTAKAQELFAYLLFRRHQPVRKDMLVDILWPEADAKKAYTQLYTTIYQLRRSLDAAKLPIRIVNSGNSYSLDLGELESDAEQWEANLKAEAESDTITTERYAELLGLYRGDYFEEHDYVWAENERQRLRDLWQHHALRLGKLLEESGDRTSAADWYASVQQRAPYLEEPYFALMKLHAGRDERVLVVQQYNRLRAMTEEEYGAEPAREILAWFEEWRQGSR